MVWRGKLRDVVSNRIVSYDDDDDAVGVLLRSMLKNSGTSSHMLNSKTIDCTTTTRTKSVKEQSFGSNKIAPAAGTRGRSAGNELTATTRTCWRRSAAKHAPAATARRRDTQLKPTPP